MPPTAPSLPAFDETEPVEQSAPLPHFHETEPHEALPSFEETSALPDYSTGSQQALAGIEGGLRGFTLGGSDVAETKLLGVKPEDIRGRMQENPWTSGLASAAGGAGLAGLTGGGSLVAEGMGGGALAGAVGLGLEGAAFGAGNALSDAALGDPDLNAQKVLSHLEWGFGGGALLGSIAGKLGAFTPELERASSTLADLGADIPAGETGAPPPILAETNPPKPFSSFEELVQRMQKAKAAGDVFELPQKAVLLDADSRLPDLRTPLLPQQTKALNSVADNVEYKILRDSDNEVGHAIQNLEGAQKAEMNKAIDTTIQSLSPNPVSNDEVANGNKAVKFFTEQYQSAKKMFGSMFEALENIHLGPLRADIVPLMETLNKKLPGLSQIFEYAEDGLPKEVKPFDPGGGVSKNAYNAVKSVFESLSPGVEEPTSFKYLRNLRDSMSDHLSIGDQRGNGQILSLKAGFMDYLQNLADEHVPNLELREMFKGYAKNEQARETIEKTFGASVGNPDFARLPKPREDILGKIFNNSETVKAAQAILPPHQFDELLANHLAELKFARTKNGVFSSNTFFNTLKSNRAALGQAFSHNPQKLQRVMDLLTRSMIVPDAASINPSGTAKTVVGMMKNLLAGTSGLDVALAAPALIHPGYIAGVLGKKVLEALAENRAAASRISNFNAGLMGEAVKTGSLKATQKVLEAATANIDRAAKAIFRQEPAHER